MHESACRPRALRSARHLENLTGRDFYGPRVIRRARPADNEISHHQHVHMSAPEAIDGFGGRTNNRLVIVEGRIDDRRRACQPGELADERPITRMGVAVNGVDPAGTVNVRGGGQRLSLARTKRIREVHEGGRLRRFEKITG